MTNDALAYQRASFCLGLMFAIPNGTPYCCFSRERFLFQRKLLYNIIRLLRK